MIKRSGVFMLWFALSIFPVFGGVNKLTLTEWQPHDFIFRSTVATTNPFEIGFSAEFSGSGGVKITVPGFYDGDGAWKVRFTATKEGQWSAVTHCKLADLDHQKLMFKCRKNDKSLHGGLIVDGLHPRHFLYEDGTPWFPLGYECNWLWALDPDDNKVPTINSFLDKLSACGFNMILINAFAYDTSWRPGKSTDDDYGPSRLYPWEGSNDKPDFTRFNIAYWKHFDDVIAALYKHGMAAHIYFKVYNKKVNWPKNSSAEDDRYYQWLIARYSAYPNMIWDLAKEANYEKSVDYKVSRLEFIRANDPYHRLLTVHTDIQSYDSGVYDQLVDFRSHQEQSGHLHATALKQLAESKWPVFNVESGYEQGPKGAGDKTYSHAESAEEDATRIWQIQMAGAYNAYYYTYTAWDVIRTSDTPPGYQYLKHFSDFFTHSRYWLLSSADTLLDHGYCLADAGKEYIIFQDKARPFTVDLTGAKKSMAARWYHPFTGLYEYAGPVKPNTTLLTPPSTFGNEPVVLHLTAIIN